MSLERITGVLAQSFAVILAVAVLVALLFYTHMKSYEAGYCAERRCEAELQSVPDDHDTDSTRLATTYARPALLALNSAPQSSNRASETGTVKTVAASVQQAEPQTASGSGYDDTESANRLYELQSTMLGLDPYSVDLSAAADICSSPYADTHPVDVARCWLRVGDAYQAMNMTYLAQSSWNVALNIGAAEGGAQASLMAHRRLQSAILAQTCPTDVASLRRIARGYEQSNVAGDIIDLNYRQNALTALGYYSDSVDGEYGPNTRRAVRDFQTDMGFDQTGALNPQETVDLICHAAVTARDASAQNLLGIMFATGLGVQLNVDMATEWMETAATRGHAEANFNLAVIYGTGTVRGSYRLCGLVENPQRADSYLRRADELGHARASQYRNSQARARSAEDRWRAIGEDLRRLSESQNPPDHFYTAWQNRLAEAERNRQREDENSPYERVSLPGCYLEPDSGVSNP
jgi:peptidoglycan hydrolase-like protein with peptidoglycan-binding domain